MPARRRAFSITEESALLCVTRRQCGVALIALDGVAHSLVHFCPATTLWYGG